MKLIDGNPVKGIRIGSRVAVYNAGLQDREGKCPRIAAESETQYNLCEILASDASRTAMALDEALCCEHDLDTGTAPYNQVWPAVMDAWQAAYDLYNYERPGHWWPCVIVVAQNQ